MKQDLLWEWWLPRALLQSDCTGKPFLVQPGNREWVTSIECINAAGWALPPFPILKGKAHIEAWYGGGKLPPDWRLHVSPNGWTTNEIGLIWLREHSICTYQAEEQGNIVSWYWTVTTRI